MVSCPPATVGSDTGESRLRFLDALRGLAALYVALGHARYLLHEGLKDYRLHPEAYSFAEKITVHALGVFGYGREAVFLFFVLSGFAVHLRYAKVQLEEGPLARLDAIRYLWRRAKRLYPPLLFALALTFTCDGIGAARGFPIHADVGLAPHDGATLAGNLVFLMDNWGGAPFPTYGTNNPLWSLRHEAAFYLLYPLLWLLNRKSPWLALAAAAAVAVALLFPALAQPVPRVVSDPLKYLLVWWLGGFLAEVFTGRAGIPLAWMPWLALLLPLGLRLPGTDSAWVAQPYATWLLGLGFTGVIAAGLHWRGALEKRKWVGFLVPLGDCSYTLYVIHMPLLVLMGGWLTARSPDGRLPVNPAWVLPGAAACVAAAWLAHFLVERPFASIRKKKPGGAKT